MDSRLSSNNEHLDLAHKVKAIKKQQAQKGGKKKGAPVVNTGSFDEDEKTGKLNVSDHVPVDVYGSAATRKVHQMVDNANHKSEVIAISVGVSPRGAKDQKHHHDQLDDSEHGGHHHKHKHHGHSHHGDDSSSHSKHDHNGKHEPDTPKLYRSQPATSPTSPMSPISPTNRHHKQFFGASNHNLTRGNSSMSHGSNHGSSHGTPKTSTTPLSPRTGSSASPNHAFTSPRSHAPHTHTDGSTHGRKKSHTHGDDDGDAVRSKVHESMEQLLEKHTSSSTLLLRGTSTLHGKDRDHGALNRGTSVAHVKNHDIGTAGKSVSKLSSATSPRS